MPARGGGKRRQLVPGEIQPFPEPLDWFNWYNYTLHETAATGSTRSAMGSTHSWLPTGLASLSSSTDHSIPDHRVFTKQEFSFCKISIFQPLLVTKVNSSVFCSTEDGDWRYKESDDDDLSLFSLSFFFLVHGFTNKANYFQEMFQQWISSSLIVRESFHTVFRRKLWKFFRKRCSKSLSVGIRAFTNEAFKSILILESRVSVQFRLYFFTTSNSNRWKWFAEQGMTLQLVTRTIEVWFSNPLNCLFRTNSSTFRKQRPESADYPRKLLCTQSDSPVNGRHRDEVITDI